ncbi:transposase [Streptomyces sp. NPDC040724]|uniref:transposase n=1 Tax=Streptomyces sp. NPDC040724 TaxID=3155612 RepID=UPI0033E0C0AE
MDRPAGRAASGTRRRPGHRHRPAAARADQAADHRRSVAGRRPGNLVIADAGYDAPRLAHLLRDLPVQVLARMRSDRVLRRPAPQRQPHTMGRPPRHGGEFVFGQPDT